MGLRGFCPARPNEKAWSCASTAQQAVRSGCDSGVNVAVTPCGDCSESLRQATMVICSVATRLARAVPRKRWRA